MCYSRGCAMPDYVAGKTGGVGRITDEASVSNEKISVKVLKTDETVSSADPDS